VLLLPLLQPLFLVQLWRRQSATPTMISAMLLGLIRVQWLLTEFLEHGERLRRGLNKRGI
jgi:hypothetical protein